MTSFLQYMSSVDWDPTLAAAHLPWMSTSDLSSSYSTRSLSSVRHYDDYDARRVSVDSFLTTPIQPVSSSLAENKTTDAPCEYTVDHSTSLTEKSINQKTISTKTSKTSLRENGWKTHWPVRTSSRTSLVAERCSSANGNAGATCVTVEEERIEDCSELFYDTSNIGLSFESERTEVLASADSPAEPSIVEDVCVKSVPAEPYRFKRWMRTLRSKNLGSQRALISRASKATLRGFGSSSLNDGDHLSVPRRHQTSSSISSSGIISAVRTASISIASASIAPRSRRPTISSQKLSLNHGSRQSKNRPRTSVDSSHILYVGGLDDDAWDRSVQRKKIMEEFLSSEVSYVADLKALMSAYSNLLSRAPIVASQICSSVRQNLMEILQLHEDLLSELRLAMPNAEGTGKQDQEHQTRLLKHTRWRSMEHTGSRDDNWKAHRRGRSFDITCPPRKNRDLIAEPQEAARVARIFDRFLSKIFLYEQYGAYYELLKHEIIAAQNNNPNWRACEMGIEALARTVSSLNNYETESRKGLMFKDLIIKPVQRICKYPLLFTDLLRHTPVIDCPEAHGDIERTLCRLREAAQEINKATDDQETRERIYRSWLLHDRLVDRDETSTAPSVRALGCVFLCGVLHVAYQSKSKIQGEYMLCALYKSFLLIAMPNKGCTSFNVFVKIRLRNLKMEAADNGRGLQCHTAPFSWKLVFVAGNRLFELLLTACSSEEEEAWVKGILERAAIDEQQNVDDFHVMGDSAVSPYIDLKLLGHVYGQNGTITRHISIHRAATVGIKAAITQVVIKNTLATTSRREPSRSITPAMSRSQSLMSTNRIHTLTPKRSDRIRLETALEDVWTVDQLPYPGMGGSKSEHLIRSSATSVIKKISIATMSTPFAKWSGSHIAIMPHGDLDKRDFSFENPKSNLLPRETPKASSTSLDAASEKKSSHSFGFLAPPPRTSSTNGTRIHDSDQKHDHKSPRVVFSNSVFHPNHNAQERPHFGMQQKLGMKKRRLSTSGGLLKAISSDGLKQLFHYSPQSA